MCDKPRKYSNAACTNKTFVTFAVIVIIALINAQEQNESTVSPEIFGQNTTKTIDYKSSVNITLHSPSLSSDYEWTNTDDYDSNSDSTKDVDTNDKKIVNLASEVNTSDSSVSVDQVTTEEDALSTTEDDTLSTTEEDTISSSTTEEGEATLPSSSSVSPSPIPISTQPGDNGGFTNYTTTKISVEKDVSPSRSKSWAVALTSVLISFAVIFTILYLIRGAVIRKRKSDQAKLLRASISSEGYFFGDEETHTNEIKFQL